MIIKILFFDLIANCVNEIEVIDLYIEYMIKRLKAYTTKGHTYIFD